MVSLPYKRRSTKNYERLNNYGSISLNADSSALVTVQADQAANIWIASNGDASRAIQITSVTGRGEGSLGVAWTPDGKIVYHSMASGKEGIWIMEADGKNRLQLTSAETVDTSPSVSADGRYVVFRSERAGTPSIWRMNIDGSNLKQLISRGSYPHHTVEWVVYQVSGSPWKVPIDGGEPVQLSEENMRQCAISPNGKLIACSLHTPGSPAKLAVIPIEGGSPVKVFDAQLEQPARIRWTPDGRALTYVARLNGISDIWSQPIDRGEPNKLTDFKADEIFSFDWSRDNKLVISHGNSTSDVVLIRNIK
ncbi:MAG: PD40 domain-containing protein [Pyrinomonadaceae bacterium]|nr:PD40 domain-containing protein [Pyrinomonadaceae bacterium]